MEFIDAKSGPVEVHFKCSRDELNNLIADLKQAEDEFCTFSSTDVLRRHLEEL